jgi:hypothetical protein
MEFRFAHFSLAAAPDPMGSLAARSTDPAASDAMESRAGAPMSHRATRSMRFRERVSLWLFDLIERVALAVLRRGPFRKLVLARVDRAVEQIHVELCGNGGRTGIQP